VKKPGQVLPPAPASDLSRFPLHRLKQGPAGIPVDVSCIPVGPAATAVLSCTGPRTNEKTTVPAAQVWELNLPEGRYTFEAEVRSPPATGRLDDEPVRPHYRNIRIPVQ